MKIYYVDSNQKKAGVPMKISNKVDSRAKKKKNDHGEVLDIMIEGSMDSEDIAILNVFVPDCRTANLCDAKTDPMERRNRQIYSYNWRIQYSSFNN